MVVSLIRNLEQSFESSKHHAWMLQNWWLSFVFSAIYFVGVFAGRAWMESRPKYDLRRPLMLWSSGLAIFSIAGALASLQDFVTFVSENGWHRSVCDETFFEGKIGFWTWLFVLSKVPELGDTVFIVLRKQKLMFLHWYHHITVLIYSWYSYRDRVAPARYFIVANFTVHAVMYSYYALRASGAVKIPRQVNVTITLMQLIQMVIGCVVNVYALQQLRQGTVCKTTYENIAWSSLMYFSYFVLFANFFLHSYIKAPKKAVDKNSNDMKGNPKSVKGD